MCVCIFCPITFCSSWSYHKFVLRHITHTMVENAVSSLLSWDRKWLWLTMKVWINTAAFHYACEALLLSGQMLSAYLWAAGTGARRADTLCLEAGEPTMDRTTLASKDFWSMWGACLTLWNLRIFSISGIVCKHA